VALYDQIGNTYSRYRLPDRRIAAAIESALGDARTVCNVGAGAGSYEPDGRRVYALEPSLRMIRQRSAPQTPVVQGVAERLPFRDGAFDAALAVLTVHHWPDLRAGLGELVRVARRQAVLTWDPDTFASFWFVAEYLPEWAECDAELAALDAVCAGLNTRDVRVVPVAWDCTDGFGAAYWRRPQAYLDPAARQAISALALCEPAAVTRATDALRRDLADGTWERRHGDLLGMEELDVGYRLVIAERT